MSSIGRMRHAGPMDKPRRRAAGRPAGPPNVVVDPPAVERAIEPIPSAPASPETTATDASNPSRQRSSEQSVPTGESGQSGQQHRRRQRSARQTHGYQDMPATGGPTKMPAPDTEPARAQGHRPPSGQSAGRDDRRRGESPMERSLRALVSTRTTQLPPTVAMRAREVAAPTRADLAAAEKDLVIVRRYYVPPAPLTAPGKAPEGRTTAKPVDTKGRAGEGRRDGRQATSGTD